MCDRLWNRNLLWGGMLALLVAVAGCGGKNEPAPATEPREEAAQAPEVEPAQSTPETSAGNQEQAPMPPARGVVLAGRELGMTVGGEGGGRPERSLDVLEQQVLTLLPEVRDAYERERAQEPALMGSLDVSMVIEPNGRVSDLRFPVRRVSNDRLTAAVFDQMRAWTFPPAELPVQLRLTLLFVPPGMDEASILLWEKRLGSRPVMEKIAEPLPAVAAAAQERETGKETRSQKHEAASLMTATKPAGDEKRRVAASESPPKQRKDATPNEITGWYRVLYPTALRAAPRPSAEVIAELRRDTRVRVVNVIGGQWLEVRSVSDRPSGFLWWEDAAPESAEQAKRR